MGNYFEDGEHMAVSPGHRPWRRPNRRVLAPVGGKVELADGLPEHSDAYAAAAERNARASGGMVYDPGFHPELDARIAKDQRAYFVVMVVCALAFGMVLVVGALMLLRPKPVTLDPMSIVGSVCAPGYWHIHSKNNGNSSCIYVTH